MRLLLASSFELIDMEYNADKVLSKIKQKSLFYEIFETKNFA